jgi:UDP-glucose 4-epimerase
MAVLVTGGTGFIGSHLVATLVAAGEEVIAFDNLKRSRGAPQQVLAGARLVEGDLRDLDAVRAACQGARLVYHLGAQSNVLGAVTNQDYSFGTNVVGTFNVLTAAHEAGVARLVFSSSREVYGEVERLPVDESRPFDPKNAYGASKVAGEVYCRIFQRTYGLDISVLRLANVYGPGDSERVIPLWLEAARRGEDLLIYGGQQVLDFVPIATVVMALRRAAETSLGGQPVNVGSGAGTTLQQLAARVEALPGARVRVQMLPARPVEVTRFVADVTRMRTVLGIEPPTDPLVDLPAMWAIAQPA